MENQPGVVTNMGILYKLWRIKLSDKLSSNDAHDFGNEGDEGPGGPPGREQDPKGRDNDVTRGKEGSKRKITDPDTHS